MIQSMTGYGSSTLTSDNYKVTVELKSLNSKYIEINMKLPRTYMRHELVVRNMLTKSLGRGKINALLNLEVMNPDRHKLNINRPLVEAYTKTLEDLRRDLGLNDQVTLEYLLALPDAISTDTEENDPEEWEMIERAFREATEKLVVSRKKEGTALEEDLRGRNTSIAAQLEKIKVLLPERTEGIRARVNNSLAEVRDRAQVDGNR
ncbi:MAG: YicC/YloC family endoribonuclease, partial [Bacteroidota bacterium]